MVTAMFALGFILGATSMGALIVCVIFRPEIKKLYRRTVRKINDLR